MRIGIQLVEVADAHGEIGIGKQLDRLCLGGMRNQNRNILLGLAGSLFLGSRALKKKIREILRCFFLIILCADYNAALRISGLKMIFFTPYFFLTDSV